MNSETLMKADNKTFILFFFLVLYRPTGGTFWTLRSTCIPFINCHFKHSRIFLIDFFIFNNIWSFKFRSLNLLTAYCNRYRYMGTVYGDATLFTVISGSTKAMNTLKGKDLPFMSKLFPLRVYIAYEGPKSHKPSWQKQRGLIWMHTHVIHVHMCQEALLKDIFLKYQTQHKKKKNLWNIKWPAHPFNFINLLIKHHYVITKQATIISYQTDLNKMIQELNTMLWNKYFWWDDDKLSELHALIASHSNPAVFVIATVHVSLGVS